MAAAVIIRPIRPEELDALLVLYHHLNPTDRPLPAQSVFAQVWATMLQDPKLHVLVAEHDALLVGTCSLVIIPNLTRGARPYGLIENVVTHPDYRRQGIGSSLLHTALQLAWEQHCYKVMLLTGSKREATLRFYEQVGFQRGKKEGLVAYPAE